MVNGECKALIINILHLLLNYSPFLIRVAVES